MIDIGEYEVPEGCGAKVQGRVIYVYPLLPRGRRKGATKHCKGCAHRVEGFATNTSTHTTMVCRLRRKVSWINRREVYFAAPEYGVACENYKEINNDPTTD